MDTACKCQHCRQPLEEWEADFCEGCGMRFELSKNQKMILQLAYAGRGKSIPVRGVCLDGQIGGRGIAAVIKGLVKRGLITESFRDVGVYRPIWSTCVSITDAGALLQQDLLNEELQS